MRSEISLSVMSPPKDPKDVGKYAFDLFQSLATQLLLVNEILNGRMTLGDGIETDNVSGVWVDAVATAGAEFSVTHNLGVLPVGFLLIIPPESGVINKGTTPWTTTEIFLTCTGPTQTIRIFVLAPPIQDL